MQTFAYSRVNRVADAIAAGGEAGSTWIAGGTELVNWMKERIVAPRRLIDINRLQELAYVEAGARGLRIGALARMSDVAEHPAVLGDFPAIAEALAKSASQQLRNMASMGGNLMQRTRCPYFRAEIELPCNKRRPGSGCAAIAGEDRGLAIFGWSEACLATHPSDVAVALAALDATVHVQGPAGARTIAVTELHRLPDVAPEQETVLTAGELIVAIEVPTASAARHSHYLKVRERSSYEFALVSAAAGVELQGGRIRDARLALGGVAPKPWRLAEAERALRGVPLADTAAVRAAIEPAFAARPRKHNGFKVELAKRTAVRALQTAGGIA